MIDRRSVITGALGAGLLASAAAADEAGFDGVWHGALQVGQQSLRLRLDIHADGSVVLNSLDQGGQPIPGRVLQRTPQEITLEIPVVQGRFTGRLDAGGHLVGTWTQGAAALPLTLDRGEPPPAPVPAAYAVPPAALTLARLETYRQAERAPAVTAASAGRAGPVHIWTSGVRRVGSEVRATDNDLWHIGSQTKSMTATLVARLVEAGRVRWDDTVGEVLGQVAPDMRAEYRPVTFRHLLSHKSGLPGDLPIEALSQWTRELSDPREERRACVRLALAMAPMGAAGTAFQYSNIGYVTAATMLEAKLGASWETLIRRHVFEPLGLASAGFGAPGRRGAVEAPYGHYQDANGPTVAPMQDGLLDNPAVLGPAGRVHVTMTDLLKYLAAHRDQPRFLRGESWRTLHTPPFGGDYAMGWVVRPTGTIWHNGSNTLWISEMAFHPRNGWIAAAASNYAAAARGVGRAIAEAVLAADPTAFTPEAPRA